MKIICHDFYFCELSTVLIGHTPLLCCRISVDVDAGLMYFKLFQSAQLVDAYKEACRIVVSCFITSVMIIRFYL